MGVREGWMEWRAAKAACILRRCLGTGLLSWHRPTSCKDSENADTKGWKKQRMCKTRGFWAYRARLCLPFLAKPSNNPAGDSGLCVFLNFMATAPRKKRSGTLGAWGNSANPRINTADTVRFFWNCSLQVTGKRENFRVRCHVLMSAPQEERTSFHVGKMMARAETSRTDRAFNSPHCNTDAGHSFIQLGP